MSDVEMYYHDLRIREHSKTQVGYMIRTARRDKGLSIKELADTMRINRSAVQHWEHGRRVPSAFNALQLSQLLEIPLADLCSRSNRELLTVVSNCPTIPDPDGGEMLTRFIGL